MKLTNKVRYAMNRDNRCQSELEALEADEMLAETNAKIDKAISLLRGRRSKRTTIVSVPVLAEAV